MVNCQCPICKGIYEAEQSWIGHQTTCPVCQNVITIQPANGYQPPMNGYQPPANGSQPSTNGYPQQQNNTAARVIGIISLFAWLLPILGLPLAIIGLVFGIKNRYNAGIVMSVIGLVLSLINAVIGAIIGAQGGF